MRTVSIPFFFHDLRCALKICHNFSPMAKASSHFNTDEIQHIIRLYNTNIDGTKKTATALTKIKGIGKRIAAAFVSRAGISSGKRAGELTQDEIEKLQEVISDPQAAGIPSYMFNHQKDTTDGQDYHLVGVKLDADLRLNLEKGKRIKETRCLRLAAGLKVRGQRTKSNGRKRKNSRLVKKK